MAFKFVYETLKDIFPQIDARVLKAVAIEHPKDVDAAINDVFVEVIPYLFDQIISPSIDPKDSSLGVVLDKGDGKDKEKRISNHEQVVIRADPGPSEQRFISFDDSYNNYYVPNPDKAPLSGVMNESPSELLNFYDVTHRNDQFYTSVESTELGPIISSQENNGEVLNYTPVKSNEIFPEIGEMDIDHIPPVNNGSFEDVSIEIGAEQPVMLTNDQENEIDGKPTEEHSSLSSTAMDISNVFTCERIDEVEPHVDTVLQRVYDPVDLDSSELPLLTEFDSEKPLHGSPDLNSKIAGSPDLNSKIAGSFTSDTEEQLKCNSMETRSEQLYKVDFLEGMMEAAKNNKKALFSAMETVIIKMKEVELKEKAVEQTQKEAANGGLDITLKVEELKHMLVRAKEANNMHAGEVYGEKAILATEARELQSRLLNLSDERDKYLQILDEMRKSLDMRLATAEALINAAEQEKMQKEEHARKALVEQEALMEKVVEESKMLQQEVEENSKLQEFLMNRGQIVDTLQGEISVICQDVKLLKEKFDERVPFSKSLSSSQTSCILASSSSSQKSTVSNSVYPDLTPKDSYPDSGAEQDGSFTTKKIGPSSSINGLSPDHRFKVEKATNEYKGLVGDGWDILDECSDFVRVTWFPRTE